MTNEESLQARDVNSLGYAIVFPFRHCWKTIQNIMSNFAFTIFFANWLHCITHPLLFYFEDIK